MRNKIINIILIISLITLIFTPILSKADSGFDSDFGGGSDFGSSDWGGSSYDSNYSGSGSGGEGIIGIIVIITIIIIIISSKNSTTKYIPYKTLTLDEIKSLDPTLDVNKFYHDTFEMYKQIQYAWRDFDLDTIRNLVSDEMYNMYLMQLETLKVKDEQNIMDNIEYVSNLIGNISFENGIETIETITTVRTYDYLVDKNKKVIRGDKNAYMEYTYRLTFTRYIDNGSLTNCPSCGAPININSSGICEYCKSTITNNEARFIMNKKQILRQRRVK